MSRLHFANPLGIAAAHAVLDVIEEEEKDLCARANELGSCLRQRLDAIRSTTLEMIDIRRPGFMVAAEFNTADGSAPRPEFTQKARADTQHSAGKARSLSNGRWLKRSLGAALNRDRSSVKQSGQGREGSKYGANDYLELKYMCFGEIN